MTPRELAEKIMGGGWFYHPEQRVMDNYIDRIESLISETLEEVRQDERKELLGEMILHARKERAAAYEDAAKIAEGCKEARDSGLPGHLADLIRLRAKTQS